MLGPGLFTPTFSASSSARHSTDTSGDSTSIVSSIKKPTFIKQFIGEVTHLLISSFVGYGVRNGRLEGEGELVLLNGNHYIGTLQDGVMHGHGKYIWMNGDVYEGEFHRAKIQGLGKYTWKDGSWYSGELVNGRKHGEGKFCQGDENFLLYIGRWDSGLRHGWGREDYNAEGTWFYEGMWSRGAPHGYGTKKYQSGNIYSGQWHRGKPHGYGTMHWKQKGQLYKGMWTDGVQNGHGEHYWFTPSTSSLRFLQPNMYKGDWVTGMRQGHGIFIYADGSKYEGGWLKNVKHGNSKFFMKNGRVVEGYFERDVLVRDSSEISPVSPNIHKILMVPFHEEEPYGNKLFSPHLDGGIPGIIKAEEWEKQRDEVEKVILRHTELLKDVYAKYGNLGKTEDKQLMRGCVMEGIQFLHLIRNIKLHQGGWTVQKALSLIKSGSNRIHWIHKKILPRKFLKKLLILSHYYYLKLGISIQPISVSLNEMINRQIKPYFWKFTGILYSKADQTQYLLWYADNLTNVYRVVCNHILPTPGGDISARQLLLFMKDIQMLRPPLTAKEFIDNMVNVVPALKQEDVYLLDLKLCFIDFVDIILESALHFPLSVPDARSLPTDSTPPTRPTESFSRHSPSCTKSGKSIASPTGKLKLQTYASFDIHPSCSYIDEELSPFSHEYPAGGNWTESTYLLKKYFCSEETDNTIDQEMELTVWKIQHFLDEEFFPAVHSWIAVLQEAEVVSEQEAKSKMTLELVESIRPAIMPHEVLSTFWFDES